MYPAQEKTKTKKTSTRALTINDNKILGQNTERKKRVLDSSAKWQTRKMKTHNSAWTPVVDKASNEQIFVERRDLISHWFDLWTDTQKKRFLDIIFQQCKRSQYKYVQDWFQQRVPLQHLDFTTVLPRFLSLYIFSFIEPKSLSRAAQVSWHWKFLSEDDIVWMPKCLKHGWFLPYTPPNSEYGAWKRHYIGCAQTLDFVSGNDADLKYGTRSAGYTQKAKRSKSGGRSGRLSPSSSRRNMDIRPPWNGPDFKPKDLDLSYRAFIHGYNPNDPNIPPSELILHNKWGIPRRQHEQAVTRSLEFDLGLDSQKRKSGHHIIASGDDYDLKRRAQRTSLSETMTIQNMTEKRMKELVDAEWYPQARTTAKRDDLSGGAYLTKAKGRQQMPTGVSQIENPRIIFISSRVPAADLLVDAVNFGVLPIVYEYEGTTAEALAIQLDQVLEGRYAQSIGIFCHSMEPGELRLAHGCTVTLETLDVAETREFFETVCSHIVPKTNGGQFDVFVPLAASEPGLEMMIQLSVLTGVQFSSPTGIIGQYNHVNSDWLLDYKEGPPQKMYFCQSKLDVWANTADLAKEALDTCNQVLASFFDKTNRDIAAQLTGQIVFDVMGQMEIFGVHKVTNALSEGIRELGHQDNVNPLEFLGQYLLERAGVDDLTFTTTLQKSKVKSDVTDSPTRRRKQGQREDVDEEVEKINGHAEHENKDEEEQELLGEEEEEDVMGEEEEEIRDLRIKHDEEEEIRDLRVKHGEEQENRDLRIKHREEEEIRDLRIKHGEGQQEIEKAQIEQSEKDEQRTLKLRQKQQIQRQTDQMRMTFGTLRLTGKHERLTPQRYSDHPEKRTPIAMEILASEMEYFRILKAVKDVYVKPLKAALNSNRAIISAQNIQIIFTDLLLIFDVSKEMTNDLKNRIGDWQPQNTCLGDIFVRFCTHLKIYTNFVNNYDVVLQCIERCKEQTPSFRAFLKRHERIPETRMNSLQELLLLPGRRIQEYVTLLSWFEVHTPKGHQDRPDLNDAIQKLKILNTHIQETKLRLERDRAMIALQKRILNCPSLLEANRYLIKHQDAANLKPPTKSMVPELKVYQHFEMLGLFLFNDALVITRRTVKHSPFSRAVEYTYRFESSISLSRLRVIDLPDSKYIKNGFKMETPKREWYCSTDTHIEKINWICLLEQSVRTALDER